MNTTTYTSNGKLLITAEYAVLDGATALAVPTTYNQSLKVTKHNNPTITWTSYNHKNIVWYTNTFTICNGSISSNNTDDVSQRLLSIFKAIINLNPNCSLLQSGYTITTHQNFNRLWGLGTSSTLIQNLAHWQQVNAYQLLQLTFGGSGYDIACAMHNTPILYQRTSATNPTVTPVNFNPNFKDNLYFVYLNQKQNSRTGIANYKDLGRLHTETIAALNRITKAMLKAERLEDFETLIHQHETIISKLINMPPIQQRVFNDFNGAIKSLGAWGGDFVLATSQQNPSVYFRAKGYHTIIPYTEMAL